MTRDIYVIIDNNGNKYICNSDELKDIKDSEGKYYHLYFDNEYNNNMKSEWLDIKIDKKYLLNIHAEFMLNDNGNALYFERGIREIYGLGYFYSIILYNNNLINTVWESNIIYKENGIRCTNFDMYSYHSNNPFRYHSNQIEYEVYRSLDLNRILLQEKTPNIVGG